MAVLEELGSKLTDIAGIKVSFPVQNDKDFILKIYARLCLMYDEAWDFGDASFSLSCKKILRLLNRVGIAHLTPTAADVVDPRRLPRVWSAFLSHLEQKYGSRGLYPRLRKVLKQQQILAARRQAERERLQRMTDSAHSPSKPRLGDISTCSALSQNSQEDVRFVKPCPPAQKICHACAPSPGPSVSPSKGGVRSRIPVPTSMRLNVIPTGKQLARTPRLPAKNTVPAAAAAAASAGPPHMVQVFDSPRLVAPKAVALVPALGVEREPPSPDGDRSDFGVSDGASSADASPGRRRSLIPAPKTPEQALGEYIENRLKTGFPREVRVEVEPTSPEPPIATVATPAAVQNTLNKTYSAERPAAAPRAAEHPPSPAADALEATLQIAEDAVDAEDKENIRPTETETIDEKPTAEEDGCTATACGVRRDTFEVTPTPENPGKPGDADVPSSDPVESTVTDAAHGRRTKKGRSKKITEQSAKITPAPESREAKEIGSDTTEDHVDPSPAQSARKSSSAPPEEPAKKRGTRGRPKVNPHELQCTDAADQHETQPVALKKRGGRAKKAKAVSQDPLLGAEAVTVSEIAPVENFPETAQESTSEVPETVARKKRSVRSRKAKQSNGDAPSTDTANKAAAPEGDAAAQSVPDTSVDVTGHTEASSEAQPVPMGVIAEEAPKKRRGRPRREEKVIDKTAENVPQAAAIDAMQCEMVAFVAHEIPQETAETTMDEAPKRRRGRGKKKEKPVAESAEGVPSQPETTPVPEVMPSTDISENHRDHQGCEPATATERETIKRQSGRETKEIKRIAVVADTVSPTAGSVPTPASAATSPIEGQPQPANEPTEPVVKSAPVRASRRRTAARQQKSTDSETAGASDPDWTPGLAHSVTGCRRGRRAAARQVSQPIEAPVEEAAPDPDQAAVRDRTRRAQQAEPSEPPSAERSQTTEPGGGGWVGRATRGRCTATATTTSTTTAERGSARGDQKTPDQEQQAPRRRRLRVVQESDSEGGTPPAHDDALPSPAPLQRTRRARKAVNDSSRPRRALRALENCD